MTAATKKRTRSNGYEGGSRPYPTGTSSAIIHGLGPRIAKRRRDLGLSQRQLAHIAAFSQPMLAEIESDLRGINAVTLVKLAKALGVSCDFLVGLTGEIAKVRR